MYKSYNQTPEQIILEMLEDNDLQSFVSFIKTHNEYIKQNIINDMIYLIVYDRHVSFVKVLLDAGLNINLQNIKKETLLHLAIKGKNYPVIEILINYGANISLTSELGKTSLIYAIEFKDKEFFDFLDIKNIPYIKEHFKNIFKCAISNNQESIIHHLKLLQIKHDCQVYESLGGDKFEFNKIVNDYYDYCTCYLLCPSRDYGFLHYLCEHNHFDMVKILLPQKLRFAIPINKNKKDSLHKTPLDYTLQNSYHKLSSYLQQIK